MIRDLTLADLNEEAARLGASPEAVIFQTPDAPVTEDDWAVMRHDGTVLVMIGRPVDDEGWPDAFWKEPW